MKTYWLTVLLLAVILYPEGAKPASGVEPRIYRTQRINGSAPTVDGKLNDPVWNSVEWSGDFIQREPSEGDPPTCQTQFKMVYDDEAIYFAFRCYDNPDQVTSMLARRDWFPGDWIEVNIDSYFDHRTAFSFTISLSGTRGDEFVSNDGGNWDSSWDPIWHGATHIDKDGWTAETKIPLSQLRFSGEEEQTWGLQVQRRLFRKEERSSWQRIPKDTSGWVSNFGRIEGIRGIKPKRRIELLPYGLSKAENFEKVPGDPYLDGRSGQITAGLDGKIGLTSNLTLDFTINPDFGQVEADPSEVNLSAFETRFQEKRPFFIEGNNILDLPLAPAITGGSFTRDNLFYSRRIGRFPTHWPDLADDEVMDMPDNTSILGAFKLTGKTSRGLSIGLLNGITAKETAEIDLDGARREETVEPLANYFVGRLQQDFRKGNTQIGAMVTAVNRDIDDPHLDYMRRQAYTGGVDFLHYIRNRDYRIEANLFASHLRGHRDAITSAQESSARYFQRPDNDYVDYNPNRKSLSGYSGSFRFTRTGNSRFMFQTGTAWRSPGFEINDLGYMRNADQINQFTWAGFSQRNPVGIFDRFGINGNQWLNWDFGGNFLSGSYNFNTNCQFKNKYQMGLGVTRNEQYTSNTALRGGPASKWPGTTNFNIWMHSDNRSRLRFGGGAYTSQGDENSSDYREGWMELIYRPTNALRVSLSPAYSINRPELQYITTADSDAGDRYIFGRLDQETINATFRMDYCLTPNLTIQFYGSPFVSAGEYTEFKQINRPKADNYRDRFGLYESAQISYDSDDGEYYVDEDVDGGNDYSFSNPNFNVRDFNSNLVVRWEFMPGSLLYLVWSQSRSENVARGDFDLNRDVNGLFDNHPHDIFLVKVVKWFSL